MGTFLSLGMGVGSLKAQGGVDAEPNYMYAAVLGSGFYRIEDATLTVVRVPFSKMLCEASADAAGWRLLLPVTVGYASLDPEDPIDRWLPTEIGSLSFIPGIEYRKQVGDHMLLKPFVQLGGGYDFNNSILSGIIVGGARGLWSYKLGEEWNLQLGTSAQWATEWQKSEGRSSSFGLYELGFDLRRELPWSFCNRRLSGSLYSRWRYFANNLNIAEAPDDPIEIDNLFEIGVSLGVDDEFDLFGYGLQRVSIGWVTGEDVNAITFGTSFPF